MAIDLLAAMPTQLLDSTRLKTFFGNDDRIDPLTGTFSRKFLKTYLPELLNVAHQNGKPVSLAFANISNFSELQNEFGEASNSILAAVAHIIEKNVGPGDVIVHYGDEIFLAILPGALPKAVLATCDRISGACAELKLLAATTKKIIAIELTMGFATDGGTMQFSTAQEFLAAANFALLKANLAGTRKPVLF